MDAFYPEIGVAAAAAASRRPTEKDVTTAPQSSGPSKRTTENQQQFMSSEDDKNGTVSSMALHSDGTREDIQLANGDGGNGEDELGAIDPMEQFDTYNGGRRRSDSMDSGSFGMEDPNDATDSAATTTALPQAKRTTPNNSNVIDLQDDDSDNDEPPQKRLATNPLHLATSSTNGPAAMQAYHNRAAHVPGWMNQQQPAAVAASAASLSTVQYHPSHHLPAAHDNGHGAMVAPPPPTPTIVFNQPMYIPYAADFTPTWNQMVPTLAHPSPSAAAGLHQSSTNHSYPKAYRLSLLNVKEFTIEGLSARWDMPVTSVTGLRVPIRQISRQYGKSMYQRDKDGGGGKWRIPLAAYHDFASYLRRDPTTHVEGVPPAQLQIASLERARQEKGYPEASQLVEYGVPEGLAKALAPFQRGGVDFVKEKGGRALIADDMGLGKTIQGVASMSIYQAEWPLLVLCPSGARYHWENEFKRWLGVDSDVNKNVNDEDALLDKMFPDSQKKAYKGPLLQNGQINTLTSSKGRVLPRNDTKVVICSYGLAPTLIESGKIHPGLFNCAIVDESHMLKNKASKRTATLVPVLSATTRCVLLSGTPALARPMELWPQLAILGTGGSNWGTNEDEFVEKYVKNGSTRRSAELHTMLRGTIMIRRLKNDILKNMQRKLRQKAEIHVVSNQEQRDEFRSLMLQLKESKGTLGKLARLHQEEIHRDNAGDSLVSGFNEAAAATKETAKMNGTSTSDVVEQARQAASIEVQERFTAGTAQIQKMVAEQAAHLDEEQRVGTILQLQGNLRSDLETLYNKRIAESQGDVVQAENRRSTLLSRLYGLTGDVKIPLIVALLKRWLRDPTKGKICIFAHHLSVLNAIRDQAGLSNTKKNGKTNYIRIDGSTLPKHRQDQITAFQTDPSIRIALLGITAAGVAVTLTASSTVWFAELFWTPAIMIQAEDRCHRIGQTARVTCLYFCARGTLDDVLWKLIEKKFRDLGEFVEGKEKLRMVVDAKFRNAKDLQSAIFSAYEDNGTENSDGFDEADIEQDLELDGDLVHDIEELGEAERRMLQAAEKDPDDEAVEPDKYSAVNDVGRSEDDAICLSDDDEKPPAVVGGTESTSAEAIGTPDVLSGCRYYKIAFEQSTLGLEVTLQDGRVIVAGIRAERRKKLGEESKPAIGDILVAIGTHSLGRLNKLSEVMAYLQQVLREPPVELAFVEAPLFIEAFKQHQARVAERKRIERNSNDVIDLIED